MNSPNDEREILDGLVRIADRCSEALAALHDDDDADHVHNENLNGINREVWRLRWQIGLYGGSSELVPNPPEPAEGEVRSRGRSVTAPRQVVADAMVVLAKLREMERAK